jgi:hypothetical protein
VRLSGEASADPQGDALQYTWTQTAGTAVTLTGANTANPTFTAPSVTTNTPLTFSLTVTDGTAPASAPATVTITGAPLVAGNVLVKGRVTFVRIPFLQATNLGLDYAHPVSRPARGIVVRANNAGTSTQLATGETDSDGNYALSVPQNTSMVLVAVARMSRDGSVPLPRWNFSVANADATTTPYSFTDGSFNSATGVTHDINVPSGLDTSGASTGTRASAPFAVLDTVYAGIQTIVGVAPTTDFPALLLDWAADNPGGETFFDPGSGGSQMIVLSADLSEDTDEFDQHVIAHEFGHYIEHNFSRADNIGGSHGLGDKLDIRVAFGEGFRRINARASSTSRRTRLPAATTATSAATAASPRCGRSSGTSTTAPPTPMTTSRLVSRRCGTCSSATSARHRHSPASIPSRQPSRPRNRHREPRSIRSSLRRTSP